MRTLGPSPSDAMTFAERGRLALRLDAEMRVVALRGGERPDAVIGHADDRDVDAGRVDERRPVDLARAASGIADDERRGSRRAGVERLLATEAASAGREHDGTGRHPGEVRGIAPAPIEDGDRPGHVAARRVDEGVELVRGLEGGAVHLEGRTRGLDESGERDRWRLHGEPNVPE